MELYVFLYFLISVFYRLNFFLFPNKSLRDPEVIKELITFALGMPHIHSDNESDDHSSDEREERFHR